MQSVQLTSSRATTPPSYVRHPRRTPRGVGADRGSIQSADKPEKKEPGIFERGARAFFSLLQRLFQWLFSFVSSKKKEEPAALVPAEEDSADPGLEALRGYLKSQPKFPVDDPRIFEEFDRMENATLKEYAYGDLGKAIPLSWWENLTCPPGGVALRNIRVGRELARNKPSLLLNYFSLQ